MKMHQTYTNVVHELKKNSTNIYNQTRKISYLRDNFLVFKRLMLPYEQLSDIQIVVDVSKNKFFTAYNSVGYQYFTVGDV